MGKRGQRQSELVSVVREILDFRDAREWGQFHTPRNLAAAIAIEAAELQELLLWKSDTDAASLLETTQGLRDAVREIADILIYALLFCSELEIDPIDAIRRKLIENDRKYPVATARGNALKYTQLPPNKTQSPEAQFTLDLYAPPSSVDDEQPSAPGGFTPGVM